MNAAFNNINDLNQNDLEQFEGTICNVLNGINNIYDRKNFKGRPKFALFSSYCSSYGHIKGRCFKRPRRESIPRTKEKSFYGHMRNNQNIPNRKIDSKNVNGRQLQPTSRSTTPYRSQSRNGYYNNTISKNNINQQDYRNSYRNNNDRSGSYNRSRTNSYNRNSNYNRSNNSRSNSRYSSRSFSRQNSPYNRSNNNHYNKNKYNRQKEL